ncbi:hypothetical protein BCR41DRAFT_395206 [Lobosporangium transversale]|uniref:Uncharacterized protein n=1 Tax=Lobosporangium transversale TaxID=64571 RepID=A0A1Y2GQ73_9FUNG|nr:hypothetical protein BCR41DRAFT_395206 [Lobosporangium transversale]ORZ19066.1 hypothetical protein BCR41DRAFT_395206 [Lobosporangium transversale]|eukprot:XP_021882234.1 hypothetical protein BCR41DRAFT_395206 [Lobosporangium transversale]
MVRTIRKRVEFELTLSESNSISVKFDSNSSNRSTGEATAKKTATLAQEASLYESATSFGVLKMKNTLMAATMPIDNDDKRKNFHEEEEPRGRKKTRGLDPRHSLTGEDHVSPSVRTLNGINEQRKRQQKDQVSGISFSLLPKSTMTPKIEDKMDMDMDMIVWWLLVYEGLVLNNIKLN